LDEVRVYPNPFSSSISLESSSSINRITFYSIIGQPMLTVNNPKEFINTDNVKPGLYIIKVESSNGKTTFLKIIKE
jgi:hypothetical protein